MTQSKFGEFGNTLQYNVTITVTHNIVVIYRGRVHLRKLASAANLLKMHIVITSCRLLGIFSLFSLLLRSNYPSSTRRL